MSRQNIPFNELAMRPLAAWDQKWFLLTAGENTPRNFNSMTVSWGALGFIWGKPLAIVFVRPQRYTRQFIDRFDTFSLCAFPESQRPALELLGNRSGRDSDKMTACGLTPIALSHIACPGFAEAELILQCRKSYFSDLNPANFLAETIAPNYHGDYHRIYFGEILAAEGTDEYR